MSIPYLQMIEMIRLLRSLNGDESAAGFFEYYHSGAHRQSRDRRRQLCIPVPSTFGYSQAAVFAVDYNLDGKQDLIVLHPRPGSAQCTPEQTYCSPDEPARLLLASLTVVPISVE